LKSTGILAKGISPRQGTFNKCASVTDHNGVGSPAKMLSTDTLSKILVDAHINPKYMKLLSHPSLRTFIRNFMGWHGDVLLPRTMIRHAVPGGLSTGIHYDQIYLRVGDPQDEFLTAWVPLGDIAADGGGLMYLSDSMELGRTFEANFTERAKDMTPEERVSAFNANMSATGALSMDAHKFYNEIAAREGQGKHRWLIANYEAGDVVFFGPYLIHAAAMNNDADGSIRLSTDLRFYKQGANIDRRWLKAWAPEDGL
jgi:phytanoyl-CoA hydroxylase